MTPPPSAVARMVLECTCGHSIPLEGKRIGDGVSCPQCSSFQVIVRSRTKGDVPPAKRGGALSAEERKEVGEALHRIKMRRIGRATRHVELYPSWAVFVAGLQFYMSALLAGANLIAQGQVKRGKRLQVVGVVSYLVIGAALLAFTFLAPQVPVWVKAGIATLIPLCFATYATRIQHGACSAAREAGAKPAPVLLPLLIGLILAIAQAFAVWFLKLQLEGPLLGG